MLAAVVAIVLVVIAVVVGAPAPVALLPVAERRVAVLAPRGAATLEGAAAYALRRFVRVA